MHKLCLGCRWETSDVLKAAGTPMINPLSSSCDRLTLLPGEFSTRTVRSGIRSPTSTQAGREVWNDACEAARSRGSMQASLRVVVAGNIAVDLGEARMVRMV